MSDNKIAKKDNDAVPASLDDMKVSKGELAKASVSAAAKELAKQIPVLDFFLNVADATSDIIRERKMEVLFRRYAAKFASHDQALERLAVVTGTRGGQALFSKVVQIVDEGTMDEEWLGLLANILDGVTDEGFAQQFDLYSFVLAQVQKLSPQALIVLSKYEHWKTVSIDSTSTTSGQTLSGDWDMRAANFLARQLTITDNAKILRMAHSFSELQKEGMVVLDGHNLKITLIGGEIYRLIMRMRS